MSQSKVYVKATNNFSSPMKTVTSTPDGGSIWKPMDYDIFPGKTGTAEFHGVSGVLMSGQISFQYVDATEPYVQTYTFDGANTKSEKVDPEQILAGGTLVTCQHGGEQRGVEYFITDIFQK